MKTKVKKRVKTFSFELIHGNQFHLIRVRKKVQGIKGTDDVTENTCLVRRSFDTISCQTVSHVLEAKSNYKTFYSET